MDGFGAGQKQNPRPGEAPAGGKVKNRTLKMSAAPAPFCSAIGFRYNLNMDPIRELGRALLIFGGVAMVAGAFLYFNGRLPLRLGRLPGDVVHRGVHTTFYFPLVTCLLLSGGLSLVFWVVSRFRR